MVSTRCGMQKVLVPGAVEVMTDAQMICAAAFVEGGVQDACDDACSICLENFSENDPATITVCKHEYHLQCILEWSQRSKECPMCWQPLCLKDQDSQLLLAASEQERASRHQRSSPLYQHSIRDTELHRFGPAFAEDSDLEDRIMHHLAAAAMGRAQQYTRRGESLRIRPPQGQGHSHCMIVPVHSNVPSSHLSSTIVSSAGNLFLQSSPLGGDVDSTGVSRAQLDALQSTSDTLLSEPSGGERVLESDSVEAYTLRRQVLVDHLENQHGTSSSELSISESFKSRLVAASSRYRESLTRTTRGFRERLRVRNGAIAELGTRAREVTAGVVRALERMSLESPDKHRDGCDVPNASPHLDLHTGTMLVQSGPSHVPEWMNEAKSSSSSIGETEYVGGATGSSSTISPQLSSVGSNGKLASTPVNGFDFVMNSFEGLDVFHEEYCRTGKTWRKCLIEKQCRYHKTNWLSRIQEL